MINFVPAIGLSIIFVLPVVFYFFYKIPKNRILLYCVFVIPFIAGSLELLGILSVNYYDYMVEGIIILLFLSSFVTRSFKLKLIGFGYILAFLTTCFLSFFVNDTSLLQLLLFLRKYIIPILFFWYIFNENFRYREYVIFNRAIAFLFLSQIPVAFYKFFIVGQMEIYIGTMAIFGGSLSLAFACFGMVIFFTLYLYRRNPYYLLFIIGFFLFSIIGEKRATFVAVPLVLLFSLFFYKYKITFVQLFKISLIAIPLCIGFFYFTVVFNPTLNPEHEMGGTAMGSSMKLVGNLTWIT